MSESTTPTIRIQVPFMNLKAQYFSIKEQIDAAIADVIEQSNFIGGKPIKEFERAFADLYGAKHCVGLGNGTDAIYITLKMLGIGAGDEVITVANSWISTSETISQTGATPVFVDVDEYFTIDVHQIEAHITDRTKAIIPVHLYGQMCDMKAITTICQKHNLFLIEDCAQSHFSEYDGTRAGLFGNAATFSFYPGKNLGAYGDAGAVLTNDSILSDQIRRYANHGALVKHQHQVEGINSRLDTIQAAILNAKLPYILNWTAQRIKNADYYDTILAAIPEIELPKVRSNTVHSYHLYVIKAQKRDELAHYLKINGIDTAVHYPTPLPLLPAYEYLKKTAQDFPVAEANRPKLLSLPMFPELSRLQQDHVFETIASFYKK